MALSKAGVVLKFNLVLVLAAFLSVSCNKSDGNNAGGGRVTETRQDHSCTVPVNRGQAFDRSMVRAENIQPALVAKTYDANFFESAERLSGAGLAQLSTTRDVRLSRAEESQVGACLQYSFLPAVPSDVQSEWTRLSRRIKDEGSRLLGVFFPRGTAGMSSAIDASFVAVPPDTTKWTVFHELMHNEFFRTERVRSGYMNSDQNQAVFRRSIGELAPYLQEASRSPIRLMSLAFLKRL